MQYSTILSWYADFEYKKSNLKAMPCQHICTQRKKYEEAYSKSSQKDSI